jgi:hypothetical protein
MWEITWLDWTISVSCVCVTYVINKLKFCSFVGCSKIFFIRVSELSVHPPPQAYTWYFIVHCEELYLLVIVYGQKTRMLLTTDKQGNKGNRWIYNALRSLGMKQLGTRRGASWVLFLGTMTVMKSKSIGWARLVIRTDEKHSVLLPNMKEGVHYKEILI